MSLDTYLSKALPEDQHARGANALESNSEFSLSASERTYGQQFYLMYQYRLATLKERVDKNAMKKWGHGTYKIDGKRVHRKEKILDIASGEICWVSGTIFCDLHNKLKILHDVETGADDTLPELPTTYLSEEESNSNSAPLVMLEDESGRAILHNDDFLKENVLVTGCIVAVLGIEIQAGVFEIMDVIYPTVSPQRPLASTQSESNKIAFVSGLNISTEADHSLKLELLKQYLCGELGTEEDISKAQSISRLIIAGDSISPAQSLTNSSISATNFGSKNVSKLDVENIKIFDYFLSELLPSVSITMLPGANDPGEVCLPQQPLHRAFLQANRKYAGSSSLQTVTNPCWLEDKSTGFTILGTSGQNIDDIKRYLHKREGGIKEEDITNSAKLLECCIKWQNIAPTAPDTLYCYPFNNYDPFTLSKETPHLLFAGNQDKFSSETIHLESGDVSDPKVEVSLISIPKFSESGQLVIFDTITRECEVITFD
ncbi:DNA polymerase delta small subunit [[Candida] railenensis]|uniref:DNA-directed DNA polymerase n=1 Tax=[Candida] railenensis TaxID=45579 RepID=A0A9P0VZV5_9ASCO|nr:DNA polymerase delta small subunit [[Candida] railenensis]